MHLHRRSRAWVSAIWAFWICACAAAFGACGVDSRTPGVGTDPAGNVEPLRPEAQGGAPQSDGGSGVPAPPSNSAGGAGAPGEPSPAPDVPLDPGGAGAGPGG